MAHCAYRTDTPAELDTVKRIAKEKGAFDAVICQHWAQGGAGAQDLARAVEQATQQASNFTFLYDLKVCTVCRVYGMVHCTNIQL